MQFESEADKKFMDGLLHEMARRQHEVVSLHSPLLLQH